MQPMQPNLPLRQSAAARAKGESESWLFTIRELCLQRTKRLRLYLNVMFVTLILPNYVIQFLYDHHRLESVSMQLTLGCLIPGFAIFFFAVLPYCLKKDPNEQIVAIVSDLVIRRNEEALPCWAEADPTLSAKVLWHLRPDIADMLLYRPLPILGSEDKFFRALNTEILYTWNAPEYTAYALKLVTLLGENADRKYIGNLGALARKRPQNQHQERIQQALIAVLPTWKARVNRDVLEVKR